MQVDLVHGHAVDTALDLADAGEDAHGALLDTWRNVRVFDDLTNVAEVAFRCVVMGVDVHLGGTEAVFGNLADVKVEIVDVQFGEFRLQCGGGQSGIDEGTEQHVAAGTRDAVEIGGFHQLGGLVVRMRWAAMAAPKPLSMLTTVRPDAQVLSMPRSAASPWKAAP